jgi:hypothetical protein
MSLLLREFIGVLRALVFVERRRRSLSPAAVLDLARARGRSGRARSPLERHRLRRLLRSVDALVPSGGNCYRRALAEIAMDRNAAEERLLVGLRSGGGRGSGHAWLAGNRDTVERYDAEIAL